MSRKRPVDPARRVAFDALRAVHADDAYANLILGQLLADRKVDGRDAAFATELLSGTCRMQGSYDRIIAAASGRELKSLQPAVIDVLRLGTHQVLGMRVPAHAAVAATVNLAAGAIGERVTGLVNAILRKIAVHDLDAWFDRLSAGLDDHAALTLRTAHPQWIVDAYAELLPPEELTTALTANNEPPITSLAVRPGLATTEELLQAGAEPGRWSPYAARWSGNPADLPSVREGRAGVQDEGSQVVAWVLSRIDADPGPWLDLCAGPGGKSALLAGLAAEQRSTLMAADVSAHRSRLVANGLRAFDAASAPTVVTADGTRPAWRPGVFSRVLADVPCSGLGALRRRPESRWRRQPSDVEELHALQRALFATSLDAAAPGGVVAYVTCSPHRHETVDVVEGVLSERSDVSVIDAGPLLPEIDRATLGPYLQLWPHRHGTDAMFAAYLRKHKSADPTRIPA